MKMSTDGNGNTEIEFDGTVEVKSKLIIDNGASMLVGRTPQWLMVHEETGPNQFEKHLWLVNKNEAKTAEVTTCGAVSLLGGYC